MQPANNTLPPGFITVEDAIALIKKDRRDNATVDLQFLANNLQYMRKKQNYNIRLMKTENGRTVQNGCLYVTLQSDYDVQILARAITDAFEERTKIKLDIENAGLAAVSTTIDQEKNISVPTPRANEESSIKRGDDISNPYSQTLQGV